MGKIHRSVVFQVNVWDHEVRAPLNTFVDLVFLLYIKTNSLLRHRAQQNQSPRVAIGGAAAQ